MENKNFHHHRNSTMEFDEVYFWTDTIKGWMHLLKDDGYKKVIISSLENLVSRELIVVYAFVIMPNHLHLIWEMKQPNGKELPNASFNKFTSHLISKDIKKKSPLVYEQLLDDENDRKVRIWQRDPLAVKVNHIKVVEQKINYIHLNPLQEHWNLASMPEDYYWSSASFYETGQSNFTFITDYRTRF